MFFFFQAEDGIRDYKVTGVQTCALPIYKIRDFNSGILKQLANVLTMERNIGQRLIQAIKRQIASSAMANKIRDFNSRILKQLANGLAMERNMHQTRVQALAAAVLAGAAGLAPIPSHAPPLASHLVRGDALNAWAFTVSFLVNSPSPRILTPLPGPL